MFTWTFSSSVESAERRHFIKKKSIKLKYKIFYWKVSSYRAFYPIWWCVFFKARNWISLCPSSGHVVHYLKIGYVKECLLNGRKTLMLWSWEKRFLDVFKPFASKPYKKRLLRFNNSSHYSVCWIEEKYLSHGIEKNVC